MTTDVTEHKLAEEALQRSETRYRRIVETAAEGISVTDSQRRVTFINQQLADMLGYTVSELMGQPVTSWFFEDDRPRMDHRLEERKRGISEQYELRLKRKDGSPVWASISVSPIFDDNHNFLGAMALINNITARKEREKEVAALLESTRAVLEQRDFKDTIRLIFEACKKVIGATTGYVALLTKDGTGNELVFLDPGGLPCNVDPSLPMPIRGLRAEAYRTGKTVYDNHFDDSEWVRYLPPGHAPLESVMFAPLLVEGRPVGVLGLANKPGGFTENDVRIVTSFADLASIALRNARDIELLEESEARFRTVVETAVDAIITIDSQQKILLWNQAAERIFGYSPEEAIGMPLVTLVPARFREAHERGVTRVFASGEPRVIARTLEAYARHKDGREIPVEVSLALWRSAGETFATGVVRDITEHHRAEEERNRLAALIDKQRQKAEELAYLLGKEKTTLDAIMSHTGAMLVYLDPQFNFVKANRAYIEGSGHTEEELIGENHFDIFSNAENRAIFERVRDTREPAYWHDKPFVYTDQPERGITYWDWALVPVEGSDGQLQGLVFSLVETTERVRAEEKLRTYERLATLGRVGGSISHELRNPLGVIDSSVYYLDTQCEKLRDNIPQDIFEKLKAHLQRIHSGVDRSTAIIQSLLDLTQIKPVKVTRLDLKTVTAEILKSGRIPPSVTVTEYYPSHDVMVDADKEQLRMAFVNIITNAVQAMDGQGTLSVSMRTEDNQVELSFADSGPGIPPENMQRIFEPLFSTKAKGIGFGLTIVQMIIERFGGSVRAQSNLGYGATLIIRLPLATQKPKHMPFGT